jgi:hypothetical protein
MMHGRSMPDIRRVVDGFVKSEGLERWEVLATVGKLKK